MSGGFDWQEYLKLASFLKSWSGPEFDGEAARRCAVSRAYYAAFCTARNYAARQWGFVPKKQGVDHKRLREAFRDNRRPRIAQQLDRLRQHRNNCDYEDDLKGADLRVMADTCIGAAEAVVAKL